MQEQGCSSLDRSYSGVLQHLSSNLLGPGLLVCTDSLSMLRSSSSNCLDRYGPRANYILLAVMGETHGPVVPTKGHHDR
jgi:hypothetical protein